MQVTLSNKTCFVFFTGVHSKVQFFKVTLTLIFDLLNQKDILLLKEGSRSLKAQMEL